MKNRQSLSCYLADLRKARKEAYANGEWDRAEQLQYCINDTVEALKEDASDDAVIPLSKSDHQKLERAMQWLEDLAAYDRLNTPVRAMLEGWIIN